MEIKFTLIFLAIVCATQVFGGCVLNTSPYGNNTFTIDNVPASGVVFSLSNNNMVHTVNNIYKCDTTPCYFPGTSAVFSMKDNFNINIGSPLIIC